MANLATINNNILADSGIDPLSLIVGTGTVNYVPKFTAEDTVANSQIFDNGTNVGINTASPSAKLDVVGGNGDGIQYRTSTRAIGIGQVSNEPSIFWGSGTPLTFLSGGELMRITSGGALLVGTTSNPYSLGALVVNHNSSLTRTYFQRGVDLIEIVPSDGTQPNQISSSYTISGSGYKPLSISARQNQADLYLTTGGLVGIGTTSPGSKLQVNSVAGNYGIVNTNGTVSVGTYIEASNSYASFGTSSNHPIGFFTNNNAPQMYITTAGNVGIGTTSPGTRLVVQQSADNAIGFSVTNPTGRASVFGYSSTFQLDIGSSTNDNIRYGNFGVGSGVLSFLNNGSEAMRITSGGDLLVGTTSGTSRIQAVGKANEWVTDLQASTTSGQSYGLVIRAGTSSGDFPFYVLSADNSTAFMAIKGNGNVGIGTTSPTVKLQVENNSHNYIDVKSTVANVQTAISAWNTSSGSRATLSWEDGTRGAYADLYSSTYLTFTTQSSEKARITSGGNLLVGTTTDAGYKLDVNGSGRFNGVLTVVNPSNPAAGTIEFGTSVYKGILDYSASTGLWNFNNQSAGPSTTNYFQFQADGTPIITMRQNGNVGIGTTSPGRKLEIASSNADSRMAITNSVSGGGAGVGLELILNNADASIINYVSGSMIFGTNSTERMRITSGGNVGIGTSSPGYKLEVVGNIQATGSQGLFRVRTDVDGRVDILGQNGYAAFIYFGEVGAADRGVLGYATGSGDLVYRSGANAISNGTERLRVKSTGAVQFNAYGSGSFTGTRAYDLSVDASGNIIEVPIGAGTITGSGTTNYIPKFTSSSAIGNSIVQDYGDNVWVGSNTAGYGTLNIQRFVSAPYATLTLTDQATPSNPIGLYLRSNGSSPVGISSAGAPIAFYTGGPATNEGMRLDASGNLLVGLSSALANGKLQVAGSIGLSGNTQIRQATNSDGNTLQVFATQFVAGNLNSYSYGYSGGGLLASVSAGDSILLFDAGRTTSTEGRVKIANTTLGNVSFSVEKNGVTTLFASTLGNVGIGTNSPTQKLDVIESGTPTTASPGTVGRFVTAGGSGYDALIGIVGGTGGRSMIDLGDTSSSSIGRLGYDHTADFMFFQTNGSEKMRITAGGNLIVGGTTNTYSAKVSVENGFLAVSESGGSDIILRAAYGGIGPAIQVVAAAPLLFATSNTERMRIDADGRVLINRTSSTGNGYYLQVTNGISASSSLLAQGTLSGYSGAGAFLSYESYGGRLEAYDYATTSWKNIAITPNGGNVGIGTSSPSYKLDINGQTRFQDIVYFANGNWNKSGDGFNRLYFANAGRTYFGSGGGYEWRSDGDAALMVLTNGGNVGIGTTSPQANLVVQNASGTSIPSLGSQGGHFQLQNGTYGLLAGVAGSGNVWMQAQRTDGTATAYNLLLQPNGGNVGIGTTSPSYKLEVNLGAGNSGIIARFNAPSYDEVNISAGLSNWIGTNSTSSFSLRSNNTDRLTVHGTTGAVRFNAYGAGSFTGTRAYDLSVDASGNIIEVPVGAGTVTGSGTTNYIPKWTSSSAIGNSDLITDGSGNLAVAQGNAPTQALNIYRAGSTQTVMAAGNSNTGLNGTYFGVDPNGNGIINTTGAFANIFSTNGSERMRITSGGDIGIGTTAPSYKLDVQEVIRSKYGSNEGSLYLGGTPAGVAYVAGAVRAAPSPSYSYTGKLSFYTTTWGVGTDYGITEQMYIDTTAADTKAATLVMLPWGGNVGIGTTSPDQKLTIQAQGTSNGLVSFKSAAGTTTSFIGVPNANGDVISSSTTADLCFRNETGNMLFQTFGSERMRITSGGNVLIGSTTNEAGSKLFVLNSITTDYSGTIGMRYNVSGQTNSYYKGMTGTALDNSTARGLHIFNYDADSNVGIQFWSNARPGSGTTPQAIITSSGNVGIGTTSPTAYSGYATLALNGTNGGALEFQLSGTQQARISNAGGANLQFVTNNAEAMRITSAGNVGIGTSSPANKLQIGSVGSTGFGGNDIAIGNGSQVMTFYQSATISTWYTNTSFSLMPSGVGAVGNVGIGTTSPSNRLTVSGNADITGNVGIGTPTPAYKLDVNGSFSTVTSSIYLQYNSGILYHFGGSGDYYQYISGANYLLYNRTATGALTFGTQDTERMRITSGGDVGIGTSSPLAKLQVSGGRAYFFSGDNYSVGLAQTAAQGNYMYLGTASDGTFYISETSGTARVTVQQGGNVGIGTTSPGYKLEVNGDIGFSGGASLKWGGNTYIYGSNNIQLEARVNGNLGWYINSSGNVGIGTTSPTEKLSLYGGTATTFGLSLEPAGWNGAKHRFVVPTSGDASILSYNYNGSTVDYASYGSSAITLTQGILTFGTGGAGAVPTERMRITSGGNVGIGTSSPSASDWNANSRLLHIYQNTTDGSILKLESSNTSGVLAVGNDQFQIGAVTNDPLLFYTNSAERMRITSGGNVGIGTSSPVAKLDLYGGGSDVEMAISTTAGYGYTQLRFGASAFVPANSFGIGNGITGGGIFLRANATGDIRMGGGTTEWMRITSGGNVLIGNTTNNDNAQLYVRRPDASNGALTYTIAWFQNATGYQNGLAIKATDNLLTIAADNSSSVAGSSAGLAFATNSTSSANNASERMRITSGGNLLLGTTTDSGIKLDVVGSGRFTGDIVARNSTYGYIALSSGTSGNSGYVNFYSSSGNRQGYIGYSSTNNSTDAGTIPYVAGTHDFIGAIQTNSSIKTAAPSGGTAVPWKLGSRITNSCGLPGTYADFASSFMVSNKVIEVEIDGVLVYIPIVNPGWC